MATKRRFKEAELVDQNNATVSAVPATDEEVSQAAVQAPVEDSTVLPAEEASPAESVDTEGGIQVNPATVSVEVQIPTDQLSAAVAQATGDLEAANTAPDVTQNQEAELVSSDVNEDVPVEGATEEQAVSEPAPEGQEQVLESKSCGGTKIKEENNLDYDHGEEVHTHDDEMVQDMVDHAIEMDKQTLTESEDGEDDKIPDGVIEDVKPAEGAGVELKYDELPPGLEGEEGDFDPDFLSGEEGFRADNEFEIEIDEDDPAVQDFLGKIDSYLSSEDAQPAQVADALRASADFFDAINPEDEDVDEDLIDVEEEGEEEPEGEEIPFDLDSVTKEKLPPRKTGDEVLDQFSELPDYDEDEEEEDYEESIERVPCKFPGNKKIGESRNVHKAVRRLAEKNDTEHTFDVYDIEWEEGYDYLPSEERITVDMAECDESHEPVQDIIDQLQDQYDAEIYSISLNDRDEAFIQKWAKKQGYIDDSNLIRGEKKECSSDKIEESSDYSSIKFPAGSSEDDIVSVYEKTMDSRRKAIKNFRESVIRKNERTSINNSKFNEALRSSVRMRNGKSENSESWSNNRFVERYENTLDFKELLNEGILG